MLVFALAVSVAQAAEWNSLDIGTAVAPAGSTEIDTTGKWTIEASGHDIWGNSDGLRFIYQEVSGDFEMSAQVLSVENTNAWAKAGVMARGSIDADAPWAMTIVTPGNGTPFEWRVQKAGPSAPDGAGIAGAAPYHVRLVREGSNFLSSRSKDGKSWKPSGSVGRPTEIKIDMTDPILVGIALTSHSAGVLCTAEFDTIVASFALQVEPLDKLATTWASIKTKY